MAEAECPGSLAEGTMVVFGGERGKGDAPDHACPGRKLAMGAMLGVVAALLDAGRIQAQPAGLIVRVSDWQRSALPSARCGVSSPSRRSEEHTSELQSLMRNSDAVF